MKLRKSTPRVRPAPRALAPPLGRTNPSQAAAKGQTRLGAATAD
jgi:hypothetical protein